MYMYSNLKTLTGLTIPEALERLDAELPREAYKAVPGGADLTDICPNHLRKVFNEVFGICGCGWGYSYSPDDMSVTTEERKRSQGGTRTVHLAALKHLRFWYRLLDGETALTNEVDASGGSENDVPGYAMKGAITNAIGNAASNIGFQESVYLGKRSHKTVGKAAPKRATAKAAQAVPDDEIEELTDDPAQFVITLGQRKGQKLGDQPFNVIEWYATQMATGEDAAKQALKQAAAAYVALHRNGGAPKPTAA